MNSLWPQVRSSLRRSASGPRRIRFRLGLWHRLFANWPNCRNRSRRISVVLRDEPELDRIKDVTSTARWITKTTESGIAVRAFQQGELDLERAMQEAQRLDALGLLADAVGQAQALESAVLKLHTSWRRLGGLQERLWVESGSSTPYLRDVLNALQSLSGATMRVSLGELAGGKRVRLQLVEESPDQLDPPPLA